MVVITAGEEKVRETEQPMVVISTGASVVITAGGAITTQSCYYLQRHYCTVRHS